MSRAQRGSLPAKLNQAHQFLIDRLLGLRIGGQPQASRLNQKTLRFLRVGRVQRVSEFLRSIVSELWLNLKSQGHKDHGCDRCTTISSKYTARR